jgi:hypothetical protein
MEIKRKKIAVPSGYIIKYVFVDGHEIKLEEPIVLNVGDSVEIRSLRIEVSNK